MAKEPANTPVTDPDGVPETLCDGRFYVHPHGNLVTITFTHARPAAADLFDRGVINNEEVVRARITLTMGNLVALRDLLNGLIKEGPVQMPSGGTAGPTKH